MEEIEYQKYKLRSNLEQLKARSQENQLLHKVLKDYEFFEKRIDEKEKQLHQETEKCKNQMEFIQAYINDIIETNELTESETNKLEYENRNIMQLLDKIRNKF